MHTHIVANGRYVEIYIDGKYIRFHRYIMEKYLGRKLKQSEHVHHINGDTLDNRIENLEVMNEHDHNKHHGELWSRKIDLKCVFCGKVFKRQLFHYKRNVVNGAKQYCSKSCAAKDNSKITAARIELKCDICGNMFKRVISEYSYKVKSGRKKFFCSRKCSGINAQRQKKNK